MNYQLSIVIDKPINHVISRFQDPDGLSEWQQGLVSMKHLSGEPGAVGSQSQLVFDEGGRKIVMTETILEHDLPERFVAQYEAGGVHNININRFEPLGEKPTRWHMDTTFTFSGFMKIVALFMGGAFKRQSQKTMSAFKAYVERS